MGKLRAASHPNIVASHAPFGSKCNAFLPMELCEGDLLSAIEASGPLSDAVGRKVFGQVASAVLHCHSLGIYHGDIKPENILMAGGVPKIADFGSATFTRHTSRPCATLLYGSPEGTAIFKAQCEVGYDCRSGLVRYDAALGDVWSLGVTILACLSGFMPWETADLTDWRFWRWVSVRLNGPSERDGNETSCLFRDAVEGDIAISNDLLDLLCGMLHPDPALRLSMDKVVAHPWFTTA